jgi:hypothetical protein
MNKAEAKAEGLKLLKQVQKIDPKAKLKVFEVGEYGEFDDSGFDADVTLCNGTLNIWKGGLTDKYFCTVTGKCGFNMQGIGKTPYGAFMKLCKDLDRRFTQVNNALNEVWWGYLYIRDSKKAGSK